MLNMLEIWSALCFDKPENYHKC